MNHFHLKANRENHFFFRQFFSFMAIFLSLVCVVVPCIHTFLPLFHTFSYWYVSFIYFTLNIIVICPLSGSCMIYLIKIVNDNNQTPRLVCFKFASLLASYDQLEYILCCQSVFLTV